MASHKSALKRIKQTHKREALNRMHRTGLRHQMRKLRAALDKKDKAAAAGLLKPHISHRFDLADCAQAFDMLVTRKSTGKIVLTV